MIKRLLSKSFIASLMVAAVSLAACEKDDEKGGGNPEIAVSTTSVSFTKAEDSQSFQITSNADWKIEIEYTVGDQWLTVTPMSGKGDATVNLSVPTNDTGAVRSAVVKCIALHPEYGNWDTKRVNISQSATDTPPVEEKVLYFDNFDGKLAEKTYGSGSSWPFIDQFPEFANPEGPAATDVTYTGQNVSVRNGSGDSASQYSLYPGSGSNNIFFGKVPAYFIVNGLQLTPEQNTLQLTFGTEYYDGNNKEAGFDKSKFHVLVSKNGQDNSWVELEYTFPANADLVGKWNLATADFTLTAVPEKLYIKFLADAASVIRIDDVKLSTGNGGQSVTLPDGEPVKPVEPGTIADAIATADGNSAAVEEATVVGIYNKGFLMQDATGKLLVFTNEPAAVAVGDKVKVEGTVTSYGGLKQFAAIKDSTGEYGPAPVVTVLGNGTFTQPAPEKMDGAALDAYLSAPAVKYVEYAGVLSISGNYYNVTVDGAASAVGSIAYPIEGTVDAALDGQQVTVRGYAIGVSGKKYVSTMLVELVGEVSTEPSLTVAPESLSFSVEGGEKTITATLKNSTDAITAESDNAQFTVAVAGNVITVTAAANESTDAINGTITVKAGALSKTVAVAQSGKSTGSEKTLTFSFSDILAANSDLPTNSYGSQNVTNESTWVSWTVDNVLFKGAKLCQANSDNAGYMQMQGNASDAAKQAFFGNADAIPGTIKKIVVKSFNTKYTPNFNLYLGTAAYPTANGVNADANSDEGVATGAGKVYTTTFEISGSYTHFAVRNDTTGALYFDSMTIYYE